MVVVIRLSGVLDRVVERFWFWEFLGRGGCFLVRKNGVFFTFYGVGVNFEVFWFFFVFTEG